jgi:tyrosine-specific transport protein
VSAIGRIFAFFAIATSFLGVGIGMMGFWADGLSRRGNDHRSKILLLLLTFAPPLAVAIFNPHLFLEALGTAGGFGSALLLGVLPILMTFSALRQNAPVQEQAIGKRWVLFLLLGFVVFEVFCELVHLVGA